MLDVINSGNVDLCAMQSLRARALLKSCSHLVLALCVLILVMPSLALTTRTTSTCALELTLVALKLTIEHLLIVYSTYHKACSLRNVA
jgi:hypothetical protein